MDGEQEYKHMISKIKEISLEFTDDLDGEQEYKHMIPKIKEISLEFTDDLDGACVPAVIRSIAKKTGQHLKESISVRHHVQTRFDWYMNVDVVGTTLQKSW